MKKFRRVAAVLLVALAALAAVTAAGAQDDEKVVFTIGLINDVDSLNPLVGVEVPDYEVWNLQYATLTDKAADDFATIPGLAESWEGSGQTYTYTLREGLKWSDGQPLTAEDIAYTINRARDEEWLNHSSTVANLDAKAIDERTVEITSKVPDPKLPTMDVYIVPKHVWEKYDAKAILKYDARGEASTAKNVLAVEVGPESVRFLVNGQEVTTLRRTDVDTDGVVGLRVNHGLNVHVATLKLQKR